MQKRILSFILCAVLICGLFPTTAMAMDSQAEYTGVCTHGSHEGYTELTSEYLTTHNDRLNSGKYYLSGDLNYSGSWYLDVAVKAKLFCPEIAGLFCRIAGLFCHDSRANLSLKPVCLGIAIS